jgi:hypothetical protein
MAFSHYPFRARLVRRMVSQPVREPDPAPASQLLLGAPEREEEGRSSDLSRHAAVKEHSPARRLSSMLCRSGLGNQGRLRKLQDRDGVLAGNARKIRQKIVQ